MPIGANIRAMREARGLSLSRLAEKTGLTRQGIAKIEATDGESLRVDTLEKIAGGLGVHPAELLGVQAPADYDPVTRDAAAMLLAMPEDRRTQARDMVRVMLFSVAMNRSERSPLVLV